MHIRNVIDWIKLPFRKEKELYLSLYQILGFYPRHIAYYRQALVHKSVSRKGKRGRSENNERLEFLGDAVLTCIVGDIVYNHFPGKGEGFLTNTRSKVVQRGTLNKLAVETGVSNLILSNSRPATHNSYVAGNAFEALVGAIYLDRGYNACMRFMEQRILNHLINLDKVAYKEVNFKSKLLEWTQKNRVQIDYQMVDEVMGKDNSPVFTYQVKIENLPGGTGTGYSKKESQQIASRETLKMLQKDSSFLDAVFAAKSDRTKMEEHPVSSVSVVAEKAEEKPAAIDKTGEKSAPEAKETALDEFDLSDIAVRDPSREDIIAAAEAAAFAEKDA